ncbi:hypothetical protein CPB86DRAFT_409907 [Serendipita vermifera]|nr:hypothetical protein CPB86DRAFT_409907 [Serendipita vermifera]
MANSGLAGWTSSPSAVVSSRTAKKGTAQCLQPGSMQMREYPVPLTADAAVVSIPQSITADVGQTKSFSVKFSAFNVDTSGILVYNSYIKIGGQGGEVLYATYLGTVPKILEGWVIEKRTIFRLGI